MEEKPTRHGTYTSKYQSPETCVANAGRIMLCFTHKPVIRLIFFLRQIRWAQNSRELLQKEKNSINAAKSYFYLGRLKRNLRQDTLAIKMLIIALKKMPKKQ